MARFPSPDYVDQRYSTLQAQVNDKIVSAVNSQHSPRHGRHSPSELSAHGWTQLARLSAGDVYVTQRFLAPRRPSEASN
jgi:hypothetical protein